jgi:hypothetical protein
MLQAGDEATAALISRIGQELHRIVRDCLSCGLSGAHVPDGNHWIVALVVRTLLAHACLAAQNVGIPREAVIGTLLQLLHVIPLPPAAGVFQPIGHVPPDQRN